MLMYAVVDSSFFLHVIVQCVSVPSFACSFLVDKQLVVSRFFFLHVY